MSAKPLVSVIICVYNAGAYLRPALLSIIQQSYRNLEILIIDDGSTDGSLDTVQGLLSDARVRVFRQANAGKPAALNRALDHVRGEFYAIHDADDVSYSMRIDKQLQAFVNNPRIAAVYCCNELIINERRMAPTFRAKSEDECKRLIDGFAMPAHDPTGMYRMSLVGHLRYDESLRLSEGHDYMLRVGERYPMMVLGDCLYGYRILPDSLTRRAAPNERIRLSHRALKAACDRRGQDFESQILKRRTGPRKLPNDNNIAAHFMRSVVDQRIAGYQMAAFKTGVQCVRLHPLDVYYYKALIYVFVPLTLVNFLRKTITRGSSGIEPGQRDSTKPAYNKVDI